MGDAVDGLERGFGWCAVLAATVPALSRSCFACYPNDAYRAGRRVNARAASSGSIFKSKALKLERKKPNVTCRKRIVPVLRQDDRF